MKGKKTGHTVSHLATLIKRRGYKMYEVADATNIPIRTLHDYCKGRTAIPRYRLETLAGFLEYPLSFLSGEEELESPEVSPHRLHPKVEVQNEERASDSYRSHTREQPPSSERSLEHLQLTNSVVPNYLMLSGFHMLVKSRRQVLQDILNTACVALTLSPYELLPQESRARIDVATIRPSYLDSEALDAFSTITASYWRIAKNASVDILNGLSGHFSTLIHCFKDPHPENIYQRLCSLTSENALILGKTFHDLKEYDLAWAYYTFAVKLALDMGNTALWAAGIGRMALLLIYWGKAQQALPLLQEAQRTPLPGQRITLWLAAIEAEIHAEMGNENACVRLLEKTHSSLVPLTLEDDVYATGFNASRAAGYAGACFVRLQKPEQALPSLQQALTLCEPSSLRRRSTLIADIGTVHAQLGNPQEACHLLQQALTLTMQTKSLIVVQRVCQARKALEGWKQSEDVKSLDDQIAETLTTLTRLKENVQRP